MLLAFFTKFQQCESILSRKFCGSIRGRVVGVFGVVFLDHIHDIGEVNCRLSGAFIYLLTHPLNKVFNAAMMSVRIKHGLNLKFLMIVNNDEWWLYWCMARDGVCLVQRKQIYMKHVVYFHAKW